MRPGRVGVVIPAGSGIPASSTCAIARQAELRSALLSGRFRPEGRGAPAFHEAANV